MPGAAGDLPSGTPSRVPDAGGIALAPSDGTNPPDSSYAVAVVPAEGAVGAPAAVTISVTPGAGYKMNLEYDGSINFLGDVAGVSVGKPDKKLTEKQLSIQVPLTASASGAHTIPAQLKFAVCTETTCIPKKHKVALALTTR